MPWILGIAIGALVVALLLIWRRDLRVGHHEQSTNQGFAMMLVGLSMISIGIVGAVMDWSSASFAISTVGLVFVGVGARRRRQGSNR